MFILIVLLDSIILDFNNIQYFPMKSNSDFNKKKKRF